jgi:hypothetical protein
MEIQPAISSRVRPQPKQYPVFRSIEQTRMQGDSIAVMIVSLNIGRKAKRISGPMLKQRSGTLSHMVHPLP